MAPDARADGAPSGPLDRAALAEWSTIGAFVVAVLAGAAPSALGFAPRAGPLRAVALGLSTFLRRPFITKSIRTAEVEAMRADLKRLMPGDYMVTVGPRGVGA